MPIDTNPLPQWKIVTTSFSPDYIIDGPVSISEFRDEFFAKLAEFPGNATVEWCDSDVGTGWFQVSFGRWETVEESNARVLNAIGYNKRLEDSERAEYEALKRKFG